MLSRSAQNGSSSEYEFTAQDTAEVQSIISGLESEGGNSWSKTFLKAVSKINIFKYIKGSPESVYGALMHFFFSSASLTNSGQVYVKMWNAWFAFRSFVLSPILSATFIYYPEYFSTIMDGKKGISIPTSYNGGLRPFYIHEVLRLRQLFGSDRLKELNAFEDAILPVESKIHQAALKYSFSATLRRVQNKDALKTIFETNGVTNLGDPTLSSLPRELRNYFYAHYAELSSRATESFLREFLKSNGVDASATGADLKELSLPHIEALTKADYDAETLLNRVYAESPRFDDEVTSNLAAQFNLRNASLLHPGRNRQISRLQSVQRQAGNAQAMARAVRATKAAILVDKPLEFVMDLILLAGVTEGINVPIHDEMFSADAWFYLGRYPFITGYISGVITSVLADIWMKLQQDEQNEGKFDDVPTGKDAEQSFGKYWFKRTFKNPENTLWKNQLHFNRIIWANMRAALVMILVTNFLSLHRFDIDMYIVGYLFSYGIPMGGLAFKIEQGFELASAWYAKAFPEKLRSHPEAQKYLNARVGMARIKFNMYYKIYENFLGVWMSNLQTLGTQTLGPRALTRWLFAGYTPTEIVANGLDWVGDKGAIVPGLTACTKALRSLVTTNYTAGIHLKSPP